MVVEEEGGGLGGEEIWEERRRVVIWKEISTWSVLEVIGSCWFGCGMYAVVGSNRARSWGELPRLAVGCPAT